MKTKLQSLITELEAIPARSPNQEIALGALRTALDHILYHEANPPPPIARSTQAAPAPPKP